MDGRAPRHPRLFDVLCGREDPGETGARPVPLAAERSRPRPPPAWCFEDLPNVRAAALRAAVPVAVPNALTRELLLPDPDLVVSSLAERPLGEILAALAGVKIRPADDVSA
jgi:hypothetical protein